ncbi:hypothetical protein ABT274_07745 [Streptomyces sp. NPDC001127]|uniref:hypothetical protein n=1 Tax=Streptomyces sp. NPDC001127 TaxID=3154377 RepID=UPI003323300F
MAAALAGRGKSAGFGCRAVVADCAYSVSDEWYFALREAGLAYMVAFKPHRATWVRADQPHTPIEAVHALAWRDARRPGDWTTVKRHFRDGHTETWWARWPPGRLRTRITLPAGRGHHRPGLPAGEGHLVPGHQPAPPRRTPRHHRPTPAGRPRRDHPPLRTAAMDRAELQTHQGRTRLGRLLKSAPTAPSAATRPWSTAPSPSAGTSGLPHPDPSMPPHGTPAPTRGQRGAQPNPSSPQREDLPTPTPINVSPGQPLPRKEPHPFGIASKGLPVVNSSAAVDGPSNAPSYDMSYAGTARRRSKKSASFRHLPECWAADLLTPTHQMW